MITSDEYRSSGVPRPITELTTEQDLQMRLMYDAVSKPSTQREDVTTILMALQHQNFILSNSLMNLVKKWPSPTRSKQGTPSASATTPDLPTTKEVKPRFGTLFGITI